MKNAQFYRWCPHWNPIHIIRMITRNCWEQHQPWSSSVLTKFDQMSDQIQTYLWPETFFATNQCKIWLTRWISLTKPTVVPHSIAAFCCTNSPSLVTRRHEACPTRTASNGRLVCTSHKYTQPVNVYIHTIQYNYNTIRYNTIQYKCNTMQYNTYRQTYRHTDVQTYIHGIMQTIYIYIYIHK